MKDRRGNEPGDERRDTRHAGRPPLTFLAHAGHLSSVRFPSLAHSARSDCKERRRVEREREPVRREDMTGHPVRKGTEGDRSE